MTAPVLSMATPQKRLDPQGASTHGQIRKAPERPELCTPTVAPGAVYRLVHGQDRRNEAEKGFPG